MSELGIRYACGKGHIVMAWDAGAAVNLEGYFCPVCMGALIGAGTLIDPRILAPAQEGHVARVENERK